MLFMIVYVVFFFFKQKTAYEMRISDWSSDVCSSDLNVFAQIIRGEAPCFTLYEDDDVLAFLDLFPQSYGHTLVIPKRSAARNIRSEERRVGKECVSTCRSRW